MEAAGLKIFPGDYAPVMIVEDGQKVIKSMRYQCRIDGKPASYDARFPGARDLLRFASTPR